MNSLRLCNHLLSDSSSSSSHDQDGIHSSSSFRGLLRHPLSRFLRSTDSPSFTPTVVTSSSCDISKSLSLPVSCSSSESHFVSQSPSINVVPSSSSSAFRNSYYNSTLSTSSRNLRIEEGIGEDLLSRSEILQLYAASRKLHAEINPTKTIRAMVHEIVKLLKCERCLLYIYDADANILRLSTLSLFLGKHTLSSSIHESNNNKTSIPIIHSATSPTFYTSSSSLATTTAAAAAASSSSFVLKSATTTTSTLATKYRIVKDDVGSRGCSDSNITTTTTADGGIGKGLKNNQWSNVRSRGDGGGGDGGGAGKQYRHYHPVSISLKNRDRRRSSSSSGSSNGGRDGKGGGGGGNCNCYCSSCSSGSATLKITPGKGPVGRVFSSFTPLRFFAGEVEMREEGGEEEEGRGRGGTVGEWKRKHFLRKGRGREEDGQMEEEEGDDEEEEDDEEADFWSDYNSKVEKLLGFKIASSLVCPVVDAGCKIIGVLHAINKKRMNFESDQTSVFSGEKEKKKSEEEGRRETATAAAAATKCVGVVREEEERGKKRDEGDGDYRGERGNITTNISTMIPETTEGGVESQSENEIYFHFTDEDEIMLLNFGITAGLALRNAAIFQDAVASRERAHGLLTLLQSLRKTLGVQSALVALTSHAKQLVCAEHCSVFLVDSLHSQLRSISSDTGEEVREPLKEGAAGLCATSGHVIISQCASDDEIRYNRVMEGVHNFACVPIHGENEPHFVIGVIQILNKIDELGDVQRFTDEDIRILDVFGRIVAPKLEASEFALGATKESYSEAGLVFSPKSPREQRKRGGMRHVMSEQEIIPEADSEEEDE